MCVRSDQIADLMVGVPALRQAAVRVALNNMDDASVNRIFGEAAGVRKKAPTIIDGDIAVSNLVLGPSWGAKHLPPAPV
jgi:hypothetical protein